MRSKNGALAPSLSADDVEEPPRATGQYPGPVWADDPTTAVAMEDDDDADVDEPPSATGIYPGPVWADDLTGNENTESVATALDTDARFALSGSVGKGAHNDEADVLATRRRLIELGFDWIDASKSTSDAELVSTITLFQAIVHGHQTVSGHQDADGRIDVPGATHRWLQAANAPHWQLTPIGSTSEGFTNVERDDTADNHDFGTDWLAQVIQDAGTAYARDFRSSHKTAALIAINDASLPHGGDTPDHKGHETGLSCDIRLPRVDGTTPGGTTVTDSQYDRDAMRAMLEAFRSTGRVSRIFLNDATLIKEGLCTSVKGHDNHAHVEITPPDVGDVELVDAAQAKALAASFADARPAPDNDRLSIYEYRSTGGSLYGKESDYDDEIGTGADPEVGASTTSPERLEIQDIYRIVRATATTHSGDDLYSCVVTDLDDGSGNGKVQRFGVGFGLVVFTQGSGLLGAVLRLTRDRDPNSFASTFGNDAEALLRVTTASTIEERLAPVGGAPLWSGSWPDRLARLGAMPYCQAAQNEVAIEHQFRPMLRVAMELGLTTERTLAMAYDCVVARGLGGGVRWMVSTAGSLRTASQRQHALRALGFENVQKFQQSVGWTPQDGVFGPATHAAVLGALRRSDIMPLPTPLELGSRLVSAATDAGRTRLTRLLMTEELDDTMYDVG